MAQKQSNQPKQWTDLKIHALLRKNGLRQKTHHYESFDISPFSKNFAGKASFKIRCNSEETQEQILQIMKENGIQAGYFYHSSKYCVGGGYDYVDIAIDKTSYSE